jgi:hypothetical protein
VGKYYHSLFSNALFKNNKKQENCVLPCNFSLDINFFLKMKKLFVVLVCTLAAWQAQGQDFSSSQDSTNTDPAPVVITQDGYDGSQNGSDYKPVSERSFRERLKYGGSAGPFTFSSYQTVIGLSPMVGYMLSDKTVVGVGMSWIFWRIKDPATRTKLSNDLVGYRAYIRQDLGFTQKLNFPLYVFGEAEQYQGVNVKGKYQPAMILGLGMGTAGSYGLSVGYDINYSYDRSFTNSPLVIRVNGFFN